MKKYAWLLLCLTLLFAGSAPCTAGPLSRIAAFFQTGLKIDVLYEHHGDLIPGSKVYLAQDPAGEKQEIGNVESISVTASQQSKVEITIDRAFKDRIHESSAFVLMGGIFTDNAPSCIVVVSTDDASGKAPIEAGVQVSGVSFLQYKLAATSKRLKQMLDLVKDQNQAVLAQLETYLNHFDAKAFQTKMDTLMGQISKFSAEQKQTFKTEVLPKLRTLFDKVIDQLEQQNNKKESQQLEKQFKKLEDLVNV